MNTRGFTLAELLIALAILGVIATFTIPKVLNSQQSSERISIFKETIAAINQAAYEMTLTGELYDYASQQAVYRNKLNYVEFCSDATAGGCWSGIGGATSAQGGFIFHNGASAAGFRLGHTANLGWEEIFLDWNGPNEGSNTMGDDQIALSICYNSAAPQFTSFSSNCTKQVTVVNKDSASGGNDAANLALWNEIWQ